MNITTIYFDLGGVLISDPFSTNFSTFTNWLNLPPERVKQAYQATDDPAYSVGNISNQVRWQEFITELNLSSITPQQCLRAYQACYNLMPNAQHLIRDMTRQHPNAKLGILSDQPVSITTELKIRYSKFFRQFNDDLILFSSEVGLSKRDKDLQLFELSIAKSKSKAENILFIDDNKIHLDNAAKLGIRGRIY